MSSSRDSTVISAQALYDRIARHLLGMREQSRYPPASYLEGCAYRSPSGSMCAVGCAIEDSEYSPYMEGRGVRQLYLDGALPSRLVPHIELLAKLQMLHDCDEYWGTAGLTWGGIVQLQNIARRHGLVPIEKEN